MSITRIFSVICLTVMITGCASSQSRSENEPSLEDRLITRDLVNVLVQVDTLNPSLVSLISPDAENASDPFSKSLTDALKSVGFVFRTANDDERSLSVSYSVVRSEDVSKGLVLNYIVNVGDVSVRRTYQSQKNGGVQPLNALQIRGADASELVITDDIFDSNDGSLVNTN